MCDMEPYNKQQQPDDRQDHRPEKVNTDDRSEPIDDKEALKAHSADTEEGLRRALIEQLGGGDDTARPAPNEY